MSMSNRMHRFKRALNEGDTGEALRIAKTDDFARLIEVENGKFVTALDLAMDHGNALVCDELLEHGARLDVPVGQPPCLGVIGRTSLMKAISPSFASRVHDHMKVIEVIATHHMRRQIAKDNESLLDVLSKKSAEMFGDFKGSATRLAATEGFKMASLAVPAITIISSGYADQVTNSEALMAATALAGFVAHKIAQHEEMGKSGLRQKHEIASEIFDNLVVSILSGRDLKIAETIDESERPKKPPSKLRFS